MGEREMLLSLQRELARHFRELHERRPLVLPNAWDAGSARLVELGGAEAVATSSAGVSWSLGRRDGQRLAREEMLEVVRRVVRTVRVPVTADVEGGYGSGSPEDVAATVRAVVEAGAAGINLEDAPGAAGEVLMPLEAHAERVVAAREAARAAGGDLVINARTDVYLESWGEPEARFDEAVRRARAYRAAGADCLFVPGVTDAGTIAALVRAIDGPLNVLAWPASPPIAELGRLGVARVSVGAGLARAALATVRDGIRELLEHGTYRFLEHGKTAGDVNAMFP